MTNDCQEDSMIEDSQWNGLLIVIFSNMPFPIPFSPVVTEKYVVSLIMEGRNSSTMKVGVLWEKRLYHPEDKK
jgi:hypothetical protein